MKKVFYFGLFGLVAFEFLNVYFIMPFPGSQRLESLDFAYFMHLHRWIFRGCLMALVLLGARDAFKVQRRWKFLLAVVTTLLLVWFLNFQMAADRVFAQPSVLTFSGRVGNVVDEDSLALIVEGNGETKAYPIRYIVYHHQVQDRIGGKPVLITYCSVCRSGRVFEPLVGGRVETFRLVGMDHFNAMIEDATTGSWWRQATGEAVIGPLKGSQLPGYACKQMTLRKCFELHPGAVVMQPEEASKEAYDLKGKYERGESKGTLTRTDPDSWGDKSWVVGIQIRKLAKAYDWNRLVRERIIHDQLGDTRILLVLAEDQRSFAAFERAGESGEFSLQGDILNLDGKTYDLDGRNMEDPAERLRPVNAYQEFWHSWRTFHPGTLRFKEK